MATPFTAVGDLFRKLRQEDTASPTVPRISSSAPLSIEAIKAEAEALSHMLKGFDSGWGYMPELKWFQLLIGSTPQVLDRLATEFNAFVQPRDGSSYAYRRPVRALGDPVWLDKLKEAQKGIADARVAAALFKGTRSGNYIVDEFGQAGRLLCHVGGVGRRGETG